MDNVVPFPGKAIPKFDIQRVRKNRIAEMEAAGQLSLFAGGDAPSPIGFGVERRRGWFLPPPAGTGPFEQALLLEERDDPRAERLYWKAITSGDSVADAYCNLGVIESRRGSPTRAFNCFTNALEADPRHFESHFNVANLYFDEGDLRLARLHYEIAVELRPRQAAVFFNLALVHAMNEDYRAAVSALSSYKQLAHGDDEPTDLLMRRFRGNAV